MLDYCNSQGIAPIEFVEDTTSGRRSWRDREIGRLLETTDAGDVLVAAEVSRLARSTLQVLELLQAATKLMLDDRRAEIVDYLNKGVSKRSVAKILGCSPTTDQRQIEFPQRRLEIPTQGLKKKSCSRPLRRPFPRSSFL